MSAKMIVLCLMIAAASALPQYHNGYAYQAGNSNPQLGYNQQSPYYGQHSQTVHQQPSYSLSSQTHQPYVSTSKYVEGPVSQYGGHGSVSLGHGAVSGGHGGVNFHGFPDAPPAALVGAEYIKTSSGNNFVEEHHGVHGSPLISKSFYTFSGPEDHEEKTAVHHITIGRPQKHYRVIFIKNPSSSSNRALIKAHLAPNEEKTVVYVLSKNENELDIQSEIDEPAINQPSKPDVVFVKYKNPEEIAHLQATVQEQYNTIPGENHIAGEEHAPVRSVIGSLGGGSDGNHEGGHSGSVSVDAGGHTGHNSYANGGGHGHGAGAGNLNTLLANIAYLPPTGK